MQMETQAPAAPARAPQRGRGKTRLLAPALLLLLLTAGALFWYVDREPKMEPNAVVGMMPGKTQEQIEEELNRQVGEKMIAFSINSAPVFASGAAEGDILFENPGSNNKLTKLEIYRDGTEELVYSTGLLQPGSYVPQDKLDKQLAPGSYACTAYIYAYKQESEEYIGKVAAGITITVQG